MPKGGAYLVGRMAGKQFRKARWMWASATGSDDEAIRAEQAVGRDMAAAVREDTRGPVDPRVQALLDEVSAPLAGRVRNRTYRFEVAALAGSEPNAFALPGGYIFVAPALVELAGHGRDELAFIVAHEMAHVIRRHAIDRILSQRALQAVTLASSAARSIAPWVRTVGIDATTLEANAAMRSIVRRDTGESYGAFLTRLAEASGLSTPTRAELARFDRTRKKKGSNADWTHPHDPDAKIAKMKDGRTHLAHTAEHAVDLDTGAIVGVTVQDASAGDTTTLVDTLVTAAEQVEAVGAPGIAEVVADKGYHSNETMVGFAAIGVRSYVSEPDRGRRHWKGRAAARDAVYANRRRIRGARGKRLLRQGGELLERPNAHLYETGRMRRVHLRGHPNILKRLLVQVCGVNLGLLMRHLTGVGTPRSLQGRASALVEALIGLLSGCWGRMRRFWAPERHDRPDSSWDGPTTRQYGHAILD